MAAFLLFLLLISAVNAQQRQSNISLGSSLTPTTTSSWLSRSGLFAFGFVPQSNGYAVAIFLAGIPQKTVVWTANRDNNPTVSNNVVLQLTRDGRLILRQSEGQAIEVVDSSLSIAWASMLDNGNFVLYDSNSRIIWQSFDHPTDTLLTGQHLPSGRELFSSASESDLIRGIFRLKMQTDGNLVQYPVNTPDTGTYAYWSSGTYNAGSNISLNLGKDGYLYLFNGSSVLKNLTPGGYPVARTIYLMRIDADGIFRLYSHTLNGRGNWTITWQTTNDVCTPKGLCGVNSYCVLMDTVAACRCLPGFDLVQSGNWTAGCERNFTAQVCGDKDHGHRAKFEMREVESTKWEDGSYDGLDTINEEECKQACLEDCNCEVAFFDDRRCLKQRLPLRYGSRRLSESNVALVKVSISSPDTIAASSSIKVKKVVRVDILIISISLVALAFLGVAISWIYARRARTNFGNYGRISEVTLVEDVGLRAFTYADLVKATNNFQEELGRGASGTVYKGDLENSQKMVAVKRLEKDFAQGEREFQTEVKTIGKTYHRNLVRLLGYCLDGPSKLLVLEYMSNGSLANVLFRHDKQLSWAERVKLARDIARGILYLHEECGTQIIHCDIKPQNILLDENGCARISDFGLAKLLKQDETKTYTGIRGTKGYVAPEWHQRQPVTVKADVYSFGIVLLEIICCRKSVEWDLPEDEAILEEWVYNCYETGELSKLVVDDIVDQRKLERMVKIGIWCIQDEPSLRPSMKRVLLMLEGTVEIPIPPNPTSFLSSTYSSLI